MELKRVPVSKLGSAPLGFKLDKEKLLGSISQLDNLLKAEGIQGRVSQSINKDAKKSNF